MTSREFRERSIRRARRVDVQVSQALARSLEQSYRLLALWNPKINLTGLPLSPPGTRRSTGCWSNRSLPPGSCRSATSSAST